jgi:hypothetical protein
MASITDPRKLKQGDLEVTPRTVVGAPAGSDGQIVPVTDNPGVHLMVREGGVLVPVVEVSTPIGNQTLEPIIMRVDPVAGVSPAAGIKVVDQAGYDALGGDLLYAQDAIDILPDILMYNVVVTLAAGTHGVKPGSGGSFPGRDKIIAVPERIKSGMPSSALVLDFVNNRFWFGLHFEGEDITIIDASQSGTVSSDGYIVTRDTGTWTAHEHRGRLIQIDSGAGAGNLMPILDNTATTLELGDASTAGTMAFTIYEPSAVLDGAGSFIAIDLAATVGESAIHTVLYNVKVGTETSPMWITCYAFLVTVYSMYFLSDYSSLNRFGLMRTVDCSFRFLGVTVPFALDGHAMWFAWGCAMSGYGSSPFITVNNGGILYFLENALLAESGHGAGVPLINIESFGQLDADYHLRLFGNGICDLLRVRGVPSLNNATGRNVPLTLKNAVNAIVFDGGVSEILPVFSVAPTGITNGWVLQNGAQVQTKNPTDMVATNLAIIDGETFTSADFSAVGDAVVGRYGSSMTRVVS